MSLPDLLANQARGARESLTNASQGQCFRPSFLKVTPVGKSKIAERQKVWPTPLAARLYGIDFLGGEPLPGTNNCQPFRNYSALGTLGLSFANARPATVTGYLF